MHSAEDAIEAVAGTHEGFSGPAGVVIHAADEGTEAAPPWDSWVTESSLIGHSMGSWDHVSSSNQHWCVVPTDGILVAL